MMSLVCRKPKFWTETRMKRDAIAARIIAKERRTHREIRECTFIKDTSLQYPCAKDCNKTP